MRPSTAVLRAFGVAGPARRLPGGQGASWRADNLVLKPLDMPADALHWLHAVARLRAASSGLRLSLPAEDAHGRLIVEGWTAFPYLEGTHEPDRWSEKAEAARAFAAAFDGVPRPAFIPAREDPWARADRFAWGEENIPGAETAPGVPDLLAARLPVDARSGLVHGDLAGNILFDPVEGIAVIDLALYWRPAEYAVAIIVADAISSAGVPLGRIQGVSADPAFPQYLLRALLFRIVTDWLTGSTREELAVYREPVRQAVDLALRV